jgi:HAE1 family hydrophobic/amphiphilic exporter-1
LAIGLVVDDAIVVVEAVQNHIEQGKDRKTATLSAMKEVSGPIVSTALVISCVFLPTILLPGVSGLLFEQFALTIGASIILSAFCALSLSPALSSLLLRQEAVRHGLLGRLFHVFNTSFNWLRNAYISLCSSLMRRIGIGIGLLAIITALIWPIAHSLPSGFMPIEDQGYLFAGISLPENTSLNTTEESSAQAEKILQNIPGVATVTTINGFNLMNSVQSPSNAFFFITLDSWAHRKSPSLAASQIASQIRQRFGDEITSGITYVVQPSPIPGVGTSGNVTFLLEDRQGQGESYLTSHTAQFIKAAEESPAIASINNFMIPSVFQYKLNVDTAQATLQGVDVADVFSTLQAYLGSVFVDYFNLYGLQWQVYLQADMNSRDSIDRLSLFHVQTTDGQNVPLNALVSTSPIWAPDFLMRQNMFNCSMLDVSAADGYSSGDVMAALEEVFHKTMPLGMGYDYSGMSYQEQQAAQGLSAGMIFAASTLFVFLILASLYESWTLPLSVLMSVPIAIVGALLSLHFAGLELNIYSEIGLIVTIALAAKNAILIVEFAVLELNRGVPLFQATLNAARIRFRPILMTSIAFICGCIPLALASGAGAAARHVVGICVIGGMLAAVCLGTLLVPVFFLLIAKRKTPPSDIV